MMSKTIQPLKRQSLAEEVADNLQQLIEGGKYSLGEKLPTEPELMQQFEVGRSSIREAVRILANKEFVKVQQGLGTFVQSLTGVGEAFSQRFERADFADLNEVRHLLESRIAEKAAQNRTQKDLEKMRSLLKKRKEYATAGKLRECIEADINFHITLAEAAKNEIMLDIYRTASIHVKASFYDRFADCNSFLETQQTHEELLASIENKDKARALKAVSKISKYKK